MTVYLWKADQTEPGKTGTTYATTQRNAPPAPIEPTPAADGLVYDESLYGEWELLGKVNGEAFVNYYDQPMIRMETREMAGTVMYLAEVARLGWYSR